MKFEYAGKNYRLAFKHDASRKWEDHAGQSHVVALWKKGGKSVLFCDTCGIQLSHLSKELRTRKTTCTIYEVVAEQKMDGYHTYLSPVLVGVARPNERALVRIKGNQLRLIRGSRSEIFNIGEIMSTTERCASDMVKIGQAEMVIPGDRYEREKGRHTALINALEVPDADYLEVPTLAADRGFRAAVWGAYYGRKKPRTINLDMAIESLDGVVIEDCAFPFDPPKPATPEPLPATMEATASETITDEVWF